MQQRIGITNNKRIEVVLGLNIITCLIIGIMLSIVLNSCGIFCIGIGTSLICLEKKLSFYERVTAVLFLMILNYLIYLDIVSFDFMPQAYDLLKTNSDLFFLFQNGHIHAIRLAIAYPGYLMKLLFNIDLDVAFSYYCTIVFTLLFVYLMRLCGTFYLRSFAFFYAICAAFFSVFLSFIMNGRIIFAFLGFSILIEQMTELYNNRKPKGHWYIRYTKWVIAVILSTVSSGTMMVCGLYVAIMFVLRIIKFRKIEKAAVRLIIILTIGIPVIIYAVQYLAKMIDKNISYFGGGVLGIVNMLQHGIGRIFGTPTIIMIVWLLLMGAVVLTLNVYCIIMVYKHLGQLIPLIIAANIAFYGAFVGLSTGSLIIVPLLIIIIGQASKLLSRIGEKNGQKNRNDLWKVY